MILPSGIRAAANNNIWSVNHSQKYFQETNYIAQVDSPPITHQHAGLFLAREALKNGDERLALERLQPMLEKSHPLALDIYAEILLDQGNFEEAFSVWTRFRNINSLVTASMKLRTINRPDLVLLYNQSLYEIFPEKYTPNIVYALLDKGDYEGAIATIAKSLAQYPYSKNRSTWLTLLSNIYVLQGDIHLVQGEWQQAEIAYKQALAEDQHNTHAWIALGKMYYKKDQDLEKTIMCFNFVTNLDPQNSERYFIIAREYWRIDQAELASQTIELALHLMDPADANYYTLAGQIYEANGSTQRALEAFEEALSIEPGNTTALQGVERVRDQN